MLEAGERNAPPEPRGPAAAQLAALALVLVGFSFLAIAHAKIDLRDESCLWYGGIAVTKGQIPMRDFQAYDPLRYYWVAAFLTLLDRGIVPMRIACSAFHFPGVLCGLLVVRRLTRSWTALVAAGVLLTLWLFPPFMLNHTVALVGVWVAVRLVERPSMRRHLVAGVFVGLATFFGRNLGLYALVSFTLLVALIWWKIERRDPARRLVAFGGGGLLGYAPMLAMLIATPGLRDVYTDAMRWLAQYKNTNLPLPVLWPWRATSVFEAANAVFWLLCPLFYAGAVAWVLAARRDDLLRRPVLVAAAVTGFPYLHYAFSRADIQHLGMSIHPFLLGVLALPFAVAARWRAAASAVVGVVAIASTIALVRVHPLYIRATAPAGWYVPLTVGRWTVSMPWYQARFIQGAIRFNDSMVRSDEGLLVVPHVGPGLYAILDRESPVWELYFLHPHPEWWQRRMIDQLERNHVNWVLYEDVRTDGREELRFARTHALMWQYIEREFDVFPVDGLPEGFTLYRRRDDATAR